MKKHIIAGTALAIGLFGAFSASAAEACDKCIEKQALQQFNQETSGLTATLKAKILELRGLYGYESVDIHKVNQLEAEIKELKDRIDLSATKLGIPPCSRG